MEEEICGDCEDKFDCFKPCSKVLKYSKLPDGCYQTDIQARNNKVKNLPNNMGNFKSRKFSLDSK